MESGSYKDDRGPPLGRSVSLVSGQWVAGSGSSRAERHKSHRKAGIVIFHDLCFSLDESWPARDSASDFDRCKTSTHRSYLTQEIIAGIDTSIMRGYAQRSV